MRESAPCTPADRHPGKFDYRVGRQYADDRCGCRGLQGSRSPAAPAWCCRRPRKAWSTLRRRRSIARTALTGSSSAPLTKSVAPARVAISRFDSKVSTPMICGHRDPRALDDRQTRHRRSRRPPRSAPLRAPRLPQCCADAGSRQPQPTSAARSSGNSGSIFTSEFVQVVQKQAGFGKKGGAIASLEMPMN